MQNEDFSLKFDD